MDRGVAMVKNYVYVQRYLPQTKGELKDLLFANFKDASDFKIGVPSQKKGFYLNSGNWCWCSTCNYLVRIDSIKKKTCPICGTYYRYTIRTNKVRKGEDKKITIILTKRDK